MSGSLGTGGPMTLGKAGGNLGKLNDDPFAELIDGSNGGS
jgi:hypothetical protein